MIKLTPPQTIPPHFNVNPSIATKMGESWGCWKGCIPASTGCKNCYATQRIIPRWYHLKPGQVTVNKDFERKPYRWKTPQMVFVCPISDFFLDHAVPNQYRQKAWDVMRNTPQHTYRICTKHPENIHKMLPNYWPMKNVWLGTSAENQYWADVRMDILRNIPIHPDAIRWVSAEPLLSSITFAGPSCLKDFGWIIAGGESGDRKHPPRRAQDQWFLDMAAQCSTQNVPFLLKQRGGTTKCRCHKAFGCRAIPPGPNGQVFSQFPP